MNTGQYLKSMISVGIHMYLVIYFITLMLNDITLPVMQEEVPQAPYSLLARPSNLPKTAQLASGGWDTLVKKSASRSKALLCYPAAEETEQYSGGQRPESTEPP